MVQARQTIERRVNELGVAEPSISRYGSRGDQILVQLPGVTDVDRAKEIIRSTGAARAEDGRGRAVADAARRCSRPTTARCRRTWTSSRAPAAAGDAGDRLLSGEKVAAVTGRDLRSARPSLDENNRPAVSFSLTSDGARKFGKVTGENIGRYAGDRPRQPGPVGAAHRRADHRRGARSTGSFTTQEVADLSLTLRSGALPATLTYLEERVIGPSLGADSIRSGVLASVVGLVLVVDLHARSTTSCRGQRGHRAAAATWSSCSA